MAEAAVVNSLEVGRYINRTNVCHAADAASRSLADPGIRFCY